MRVLTPYELSQMSRPELDAMLRRIAAELPHLAEGSVGLRAAPANLQSIRRALVPKLGFSPHP